MIEGVGFTTGFFTDPLARYMQPVAYTRKLLCFQFSDQWLYETPNIWNLECDTMISGDALNIREQGANEIEQPILYPNPTNTTGILRFNRYAGSSPCTITVYDMNGKEVLSLTQRPGTAIHLREYALSPGLYHFRICTAENRLLHTQKILIE
jgi:hypothetical protein